MRSIGPESALGHIVSVLVEEVGIRKRGEGSFSVRGHEGDSFPIYVLFLIIPINQVGAYDLFQKFEGGGDPPLPGPAPSALSWLQRLEGIFAKRGLLEGISRVGSYHMS